MLAKKLLFQLQLLFSFAIALNIPRTKWTPATSVQTHKLADKGRTNLAAYIKRHGYPNPKCTAQNVVVRKEWTTLSVAERKSYISALKCLKKKPPKTPESFGYPGVRSRHDDFVAIHMNQSFTIHSTANFMVWHRYYVWAMEKALRDECGYTGYQPYWNWAITALDPINSPMFDGSDSSVGGNGDFFNYTGFCINDPITGICQINIAQGVGGGCVTKGPFKDWTPTLGPVFPAVTYLNQTNPDPAGLGRYYNPRCLRRDISTYISSKWLKDSDIAYLITNNTKIADFWYYLQGDFPAGYMGVHGAGHFTVGGDPGSDFFTSPGDPAFFLHHAMIDYTWWVWQNQDPANRTYALYGPTVLNDFTTPNGTLDDPINLGVNAPTIKNRDGMSTIAGPFCYTYA
ncbi:Di-copper centre-containing protein [Lindgomyces ingoldianus]|uniref:Di-copper centre-containing protein n=1 Tax=Lindgomyces ingoldianus TaxID=673940 RepID=A0ACB6RAK9_9PLEO|nr:Di-copper centre-containing protein [Lindgomyces ingoldianus]KAF2475506.1 Di-copper centre-containing protein [Lindgomyces ingoldianus]